MSRSLILVFGIICIFLMPMVACTSSNESDKSTEGFLGERGEVSVGTIQNGKMKNYPFLKDMYSDGYFPDFLVDKGKAILVRLCVSIESQNPKSLDELYKLTHAATEEFNDLAEDFYENESEIETAARESIAEDFLNIAKAYGFDADVEELIAPRDW